MQRPAIAGCQFVPALLLAWIASSRPMLAGAQLAGEGTPGDAIPGVLAAFSRAPIVALADMHRDSVLASFRLQLIRDPAFAAPGRDIVIEWGNALHQNILDRYVAGDSVPLETLRQVWRNAIGNMNGIFDSPIYEEFVVTIRELNRRLPRPRRVRVIACDPPIDWSLVRGRDDVGQFAGNRDAYCAGVVEREVLARGRSALVIIGGGHLLRAGDASAPNVVRVLDQRYPGAVFVITTRRSRNTDELTRGWKAPAFLALRDTPLGRDETERGPFETIADGYLFLDRGPDVEPNPAVYDDATYRRELDRRWCIVRGRPFPAEVAATGARPSISPCP